MPVITLSREMGSLGDDIAVAVAARLGLRLASRELINLAARQAGAPEVALAEIDELGLLSLKPSREAVAHYLATVAEVMRSLAAEGHLLLVGRGGQVVLANHPGGVHVRITAPLEMRIKIVQERCKISSAAAAARIEVTDRARANYLRHHYSVRWDDPNLYDIVLNMAHLRVPTAVELIWLAAQMANAPTEEAAQ